MSYKKTIVLGDYDDDDKDFVSLFIDAKVWEDFKKRILVIDCFGANENAEIVDGLFFIRASEATEEFYDYEWVKNRGEIREVAIPGVPSDIALAVSFTY